MWAVSHPDYHPFSSYSLPHGSLCSVNTVASLVILKHAASVSLRAFALAVLLPEILSPSNNTCLPYFKSLLKLHPDLFTPHSIPNPCFLPYVFLLGIYHCLIYYIMYFCCCGLSPLTNITREGVFNFSYCCFSNPRKKVGTQIFVWVNE